MRVFIPKLRNSRDFPGEELSDRSGDGGWDGGKNIAKWRYMQMFMMDIRHC